MEGEDTEKSYNHLAFPFFEQKINELGLEILPSRSRCSAEGESLYF